MHSRLLTSILERVERTIAERRGELDALDAALGDGDHGTRLAAACAVLHREAGALSARPLGEALASMARVVGEVMGGSGGRMYAALLRGMASAAGEGDPDWPRTLAMLRAGRLALERESGLGRGAKTILDVVAPVVEALERLPEGVDAERVAGLALAAASHALHHTRELIAAWEPADRLGRESLEHMDPGACSAALVIGVVAGTLASLSDHP